MPNPSVLSLKDVSKTFKSGGKELRVLNDINLTIKAGEKVAIVGQSGSGKSTLLQIAGLLDSPDAGQVFVNDEDVTHARDKRRAKMRNLHMGFVYQYHHLLRDFNARENVLMPALIRKEVDVAHAEALLKKVGLEARMTHFPTELSGGEQQRVAIARALVNTPHILLADEPTGNLDPATAEDVTTLFEDLVKREKMAMLVVTHNMALAKHCDTVYEMVNGSLKKHG